MNCPHLPTIGLTLILVLAAAPPATAQTDVSPPAASGATGLRLHVNGFDARIQGARATLAVGRGAMGSVAASRRDLSALKGVLDPSLPGHGHTLKGAGTGTFANAGAAFSERDGLGARPRLRLDTDLGAGVDLAVASSQDGSKDVAVGFNRRGRGRFDVVGAAALGRDANANGAWRYDSSLTALDVTNGWNVTLAAAGEANKASPQHHRVYAKVARRLRLRHGRQFAVGAETAVARRGEAAAAVLGAGLRVACKGGAFFAGARWYAATDGRTDGYAQHAFAGGSLNF